MSSKMKERSILINSTTDKLALSSRQCCRLSYKPRRVSSKGAVLVLIWIVLVNSGTGSPQTNQRTLVSIIVDSSNGTLTALQCIKYALPIAAWLLTAIISGWIADTKLGNYKTVKLGLIVLFLAAILDCILTLTQVNQSTASSWYPTVETLPICLKYIGNAIVIVSSIQLGLDQMPDASSANITSFIAWFVCSAQAGILVYQVGGNFTQNYCPLHHETYVKPTISLLSVLCMAIALCFDFLLSPKWITKEPPSSRCFTLIYQVLRFATKHKAPLNRSSLTYWEEDIPSRLDLGKSRYGGPFTTEQVEDVKTTLKMLIVSIPMSIIVVSYFLSNYIIPYIYLQITVSDYSNNSLNLTTCARTSLKETVTSLSWWMILSTLVHEIVVYPFLVKWIPSILKRIVIGSLLTLLLNIIYLVISAVQVAGGNKSIFTGIDTFWIELLHSIISAQIVLLLYTAMLEFVCAQTPHNLKEFVIGYTWCTYSLASILAAVTFSILVANCTDKYCTVIFCSIVTGMSLIGLILMCLLAYWYKQRVRDSDETQTPYTWVEGVYRKYFPESSST